MRFMLEDNIMVKGEVCTAGSRILSGFKAPFSSTVYEKCLAYGMDCAGLITPDEFGVEALFDNFGEEKPADSVIALLEGRCEFVLCNDVFGKLRRQAPENGLVYISPPYGTVSRYGLIPSVSSMDRIGILCRDISDGIKALSVVSGSDEKDSVMIRGVGNEGECVIKNIGILDVKGAAAGYECARDLAVGRALVSDITPEYFDVLAQVFYILTSAEICCNTNRYDGVKYGLRSDAGSIGEMYEKTRSIGFGKDMKLTSLAGCMALSRDHYQKLYHRSMQIRSLAKLHYDKLLSNHVDAFMLPARMSGTDKYSQSALYALASLCGYASVCFRAGRSDTQIITKNGREQAVLSFVREVTQ